MNDDETVKTGEPVLKEKRALWQRLLRKKLFWIVVLVVILIIYGSVKFERNILRPPEEEWGPVAVEDLYSERWWETETGKGLTDELKRMTGRPAFRFFAGMYYRLYRHRYASGVRNTQYVRIGPDQYPRIYEMVVKACRALGESDGQPVKVPKIYLGYTGEPCIDVTNYRNPCVIIGSDLVWAFQPEELEYLLAREIGHIHAKHVYFLDVVKGIRSIVNTAMPDFLARVLLGSVGAKLLEWYKEAEISADRAGLLVTGDIEIAAGALIKLNIAASVEGYYGQASGEAFAQQLDMIEQGRIASASAVMAELKNPNPFLTVRVANLLKWHEANRKLFY